ncbi:MAG TPA: TetR/AcrR family transcriptional regulator [Solirubrobacteraceae bacterium]|nr:TetR/AcrR family transcriptional regulator [Solirubrobacteraceae bacterium]
MARLPSGPHTLSREQVEADQRERLRMAMIGAIGEQGYSGVTVSDVISRAGVSRRTFYEHYADTQGCFLDIYDAITAEGMRRVRRAYEQAQGWSERMEAAIRVLFESAIESPDALRLIMVEIAAVGPVGFVHRERVMDQYARFIRAGLEREPDQGRLSELTLRAVIGGINRVLYARLYDRRHARLLALVPDLVSWASSYHPSPTQIAAGLLICPPSSLRTRTGLVGGRAPGTLSLGSQGGDRRGLVPVDGRVSPNFVAHNQRERILDAVANLTAAKGYGGFGVKEVAEQAAVSLQTFYELFTDKEDAFLVAYELGYTKALSIFERAYADEPDWPTGMRAALASLLNFLASEPTFAHMTFVDSLVATPRTAASSARSVAAFARLLEPGFDEAPVSQRPPAVVVEAIAGGLFEIIFQHVVRGRTRELPQLTAQAAYIALAPFVGATEAGLVAADNTGR